jgi:energy-coupling factor transporter transmembrane protein EcfT
MPGGLLAGLDPRAKLVAFLAVLALLFVPGVHSQPARLLALAAPLLALLPFAGRSWRLWLRAMALAGPFLLLLSISAVLQAAPLWTEVLRIVMPILANSILAFLALALFVLNEEPWRLLQALRQMKLPGSAVVVLTIGYRFAVQWRLELESMRRAWTGRNFNALSKLRRARYLGAALPLFFEGLLDGGVHIHDAMISRGFHGSLPSWQPLAFAKQDAGFLALMAMVSAAIMIW